MAVENLLAECVCSCKNSSLNVMSFGDNILCNQPVLEEECYDMNQSATKRLSNVKKCKVLSLLKMFNRDLMISDFTSIWVRQRVQFLYQCERLSGERRAVSDAAAAPRSQRCS